MTQFFGKDPDAGKDWGKIYHHKSGDSPKINVMQI